MGLLEEEFKLREIASQEFPPDISPSDIQSSISRYEDEMSAASERSICGCCGCFVPKKDIRKLNDQDEFIRLEESRCAHHKGFWDFCRPCHTAISKKKIPKFSAANFVNVTMCQSYPSALEDLTPVEECLRSAILLADLVAIRLQQTITHCGAI